MPADRLRANRCVTFIHEVGYLEKPVFEMHEFPESLPSLSWEVRFIDFREFGGRGERQARYFRRAGQYDVHVRSVPSVGRGILRRLIAVVVGSFWVPWRLHRERPDVVVLYAVPTFGWQTVIACRQLGIPVVYRAIDLSSDIRETVFRRLVARAERAVARRASIVCPNTNELGRHLKQLGAREVIRVFPGFDSQPIDHDEREPGRSIVFMGTLFPFAGLEAFIRLAAPLLRRRPEVTFRILGNGEALDSIRRVVELEQLGSSVDLAGFVPYEQLFGELSRSDVAIIPFDERRLTHVALPGKVPQYLRAGLPVVATRLRGLQELLPEGDGVLYRTLGPEFVSAVETLLDSVDERRRLVERGTARLDAVATWPIAIAEFQAVLERAIATTGGSTDELG